MARSDVDAVRDAGSSGRLRQYRTRQAEAKAARAEAAATQSADDLPAARAAPVVLPAPRPAASASVPEPEFADVDDDQELVIEDLPPPYAVTAATRSGWAARSAR